VVVVARLVRELFAGLMAASVTAWIMHIANAFKVYRTNSELIPFAIPAAILTAIGVVWVAYRSQQVIKSIALSIIFCAGIGVLGSWFAIALWTINQFGLHRVFSGAEYIFGSFLMEWWLAGTTYATAYSMFRRIVGVRPGCDSSDRAGDPG
jgi:hypothetical protein